MRLDQRVAAVDVEMVGRLVEDEQMRAVEGGEPQQQPRLLAAGERSRPACRRLAPESPIAPTRARTFASGASGISARTWS